MSLLSACQFSFVGFMENPCLSELCDYLLTFILGFKLMFTIDLTYFSCVFGRSLTGIGSRLKFTERLLLATCLFLKEALFTLWIYWLELVLWRSVFSPGRLLATFSLVPWIWLELLFSLSWNVTLRLLSWLNYFVCNVVIAVLAVAYRLAADRLYIFLDISDLLRPWLN